MARPLLTALVRGTRQMLTAQLIASVVAIALAGWTLAITTEMIRERDQLRARVVQLETAMGDQGIVVPPKPATVDAPAPNRDTNSYPPAIGGIGAARANAVRVVTEAPKDAAKSPSAGFDPTRIIRDIFTPPPTVRALVVHVHGAFDASMAQRVARDLRDGKVSVIVDVLAARDQRPSGYAYFDGRQSQAAAALIAHFNDAARRALVAPWSAQLAGVALPAQGEYTPDRVDIVLPALAPPAAAVAAPAAPRP